MKDLLTLVTAALRPGQLQDKSHLLHPRVDFVELQRYLDTDILDYTVYSESGTGRLFRYLETQLRSDLYLTLLGLIQKRNHRMVFAMSERAGIPFAGLHRMLPDRKPFLTMFTCWSARQEKVITGLNLFSAMDGIAVHCSSMKRHLVELGASAEHTHVIPYSVDQQFFRPMPNVPRLANTIISLGEVRSRDYPSLFRAVETLPLKLITAASGSWYAREKNGTLNTDIPENVTLVKRMPIADLRTLYAQSQFVVLPIRDVEFSAGATAVLESACMGRAVVAARSRGIVDYIIDGETGILVEPGNSDELRDAIQYLLAHPEEAQRLGDNARQRIEEELNLDTYVRRLAQFVRCYMKHLL